MSWDNTHIDKSKTRSTRTSSDLFREGPQPEPNSNNLLLSPPHLHPQTAATHLPTPSTPLAYSPTVAGVSSTKPALQDPDGKTFKPLPPLVRLDIDIKPVLSLIDDWYSYGGNCSEWYKVNSDYEGVEYSKFGRWSLIGIMLVWKWEETWHSNIIPAMVPVASVAFRNFSISSNELGSVHSARPQYRHSSYSWISKNVKSEISWSQYRRQCYPGSEDVPERWIVLSG